MQCLYCETELKPLRGLFDEDFCCKDHREKYFASFRKGITLLPVLNLPPLKPKQETNSEEAIAEPETALVPERPVEVDEEPAELPEPARVTLAPVVEMPARAPKLPVVEEPAAATASVEAALDDGSAEAPAATPRAADFLHLRVAPFTATECYFMVEEDSFPACNGPAIPDVEVFCDAAFDPEERVAHLFAPADMVAAGVSGQAATPEPQPAVTPQVLWPSFCGWDYTVPLAPALEPAELIEDVEMMLAGDVSEQTAQLVDSQPLVPAIPMTVPGFRAPVGSELHPHVAEPVQLETVCPQMESARLVFFDMTPAFEMHKPVFQVSAAAMQLEEELKRAAEPPAMEAPRLAEPEMARPAAMSAAPLSRAVSGGPFHPTIPAAAARPEAQLTVPAMSSKTDAVPGVASEAAPDPPRGVAAEQAPSAHSSEPVQPAIQNSARIKNWRLKITFAKPA